MKRWIPIAMLLAAVAAGAVADSLGQKPDEVSVFMKAKLRHSQNVLEGLVLGDFDKVAKGAQEMSLLSLAANWQVLQTPQYLEYSRKFRAEADALTEAAKRKNLDQATAHYNRMTTRCVECHKYVRDVRMASGPAPLEAPLAANR